MWLIVPAFFLHMAMIIPSGTQLCIADRCGVHFWGIHSHDAMWHVEIAAVAFRSFPFQVPTFAGAILSGYNILMDLVLYIFSLIGISPLVSLFKVVPVLWFALLTLTGISFATSLNKSVRFVFITLFLIYFAGHFGYLLQLFQEGSMFKGSQSFSMQSMNALLNPQFALTLPIILVQLVILKGRTLTMRLTLLMSFLTFFSLGLKFYGGVVSLIIAGFYIFEYLISGKNILKSLWFGSIILFISLASVIIFYNPFAASGSGSVFIFSPFAIVHSMIEEQNMFYLPDMVNARYYLYEQGWSLRLLGIELFSTLLYIFLNFGTRLLGLLYVVTQIIRRKATRFEVYLLATLALSFSFSILLIQKGDWWNTVQFGYYSIFLATLLTAIALFNMTKHLGKSGTIIVILFFVFTIPSSVRAVKEFITTDTYLVSDQEIAALKVLKNKPDGIVFDSFPSTDGSVDYRNSGYVAAFSQKPLYLAHVGPLRIVGVDATEREQRIEGQDCTVLKNIKYIYYAKRFNGSFLISCEDLINSSFQQIFENDEVQLFQRM